MSISIVGYFESRGMVYGQIKEFLEDDSILVEFPIIENNKGKSQVNSCPKYVVIRKSGESL